ncbi:MAG: TrbC family F-type conjugative pilus assembly protein, partial [Pseudomonadota bacterium]
NEALGGVLIDPRAYRVLNVTEVPTFVSIAGPLPVCDGLDCSAPAPVHDRIGGNMTLRAALTALSNEGDAAPLQASAALARLEARP